jgi:hypothetical protein
MLREAKVSKENAELHAHKKAHKNILNELSATIRECVSLDAHGDTAACYRQLYRKTSELYEEHERLFDGT